MELSCIARRLPALACIAVVPLLLSGCDEDVPNHRTGNWRSQPDYLLSYGFIPPGGNAADGVLNSCALSTLSQTLQCSGRGVCMPWKPDDYANPISFCVCDTEWADPECTTRRKSQRVAYFLSLFGGCLGLDRYYLEYYISGTLKLLTFGGLGVWWCFDLIRVGSAPVMASSFRTAADLPHSAFVLVTVMYSMIFGGALVYFVLLQFRAQRRKLAMAMQADEEKQVPNYKAVYESRPRIGKLPEQIRADTLGGPVDFSRSRGYGSMAASPKQVTL